ncbi:hypothetical protein BWQ96_02980 [Gracilariopsis chorda]|uniref:C2 domain-containing protein n=1 Tax=Gracilariopsis chorda TaxID=448386 RepID=A0A2V3IYQ9_9FLOR|nr:hypothetical protein BWQ96_02980 [Gracilariopsis chorda]|eukprot:PXF47205.1 hypothetical protein BWQ96_02980 [Gracilariopsis chorda]
MTPRLQLKVNLLSGRNVGGKFPFAVVCFDGDISHELFKSRATNQQGGVAVWNESFTVDLTTELKALHAENRPEPKYLTFFLFDTGTAGIPSLGCAGVLLSNVHERGKSAGDFPVVKGSGSLALEVVLDKDDSFIHSNAAKITGAVAGTAAVAGLGAFAINKYRKKKKAGADDHEAEEGEGEEEQQQPLLQQQEQQQEGATYDPTDVHTTGDAYAAEAPTFGNTAPVYTQHQHGHDGYDEDDDDEDDDEGAE